MKESSEDIHNIVNEFGRECDGMKLKIKNKNSAGGQEDQREAKENVKGNGEGLEGRKWEIFRSNIN